LRRSAPSPCLSAHVVESSSNRRLTPDRADGVRHRAADYGHSANPWSNAASIRQSHYAYAYNHGNRQNVTSWWVGTKCADQSAPGHRIDQLLADYGPVIAYLKTKPAKFKAKVIDAAIALEKRTASLRKDDDVLCRGGLEEMMAGIEAGETKEAPTPPGQVGKTIVVDPPPGYAPKFVAPETYKPMQEKARSEIRLDLLKMLQ